MVATFTEANSNAGAGNFTATINWGDGTSSTGTISVDPKGGFDVSGTHTYAPASARRPRFPFDGSDFFGSLQDFLGNRFFVVTVAIHDTAANASKLPKEIGYSEAGITIRETKDLWNMPVIFLLAAIIRTTEWLLRRRWNMV